MKAKTLLELKCREQARFPDGVMPPGTEIDHPDAFWLVRMGVAVPADEACRMAAGMTPERMTAAQRAYEKVARGIHPEDYDAYDRGEMVGYGPEGQYLPGPNAEESEGGILLI